MASALELPRIKLPTVADVEALGSLTEGEIAYDDTENLMKFYDGSTWRAMSEVFGAWQTPTLGTNWSSTGANVVKYRLESQVVRIEGVATTSANQASGTTLFTLASGWRPAAGKSHTFTAVASRSGTWIVCLIDIPAAGTVSAYWNGAGLTNGDIIYLDGITLPTT